MGFENALRASGVKIIDTEEDLEIKEVVQIDGKLEIMSSEQTDKDADILIDRLGEDMKDVIDIIESLKMLRGAIKKIYDECNDDEFKERIIDIVNSAIEPNTF